MTDDTPSLAAPERLDDERIYPCMDCGKLRTKAEGGTTFTVCDACWDKRHPPEPSPYGITWDELRDRIRRVQQGEYLTHAEAMAFVRKDSPSSPERPAEERVGYVHVEGTPPNPPTTLTTASDGDVVMHFPPLSQMRSMTPEERAEFRAVGPQPTPLLCSKCRVEKAVIGHPPAEEVERLTEEEIGRAFDIANEANRDSAGLRFYEWDRFPEIDGRKAGRGVFLTFAREIERAVRTALLSPAQRGEKP